MGPPAPSTKATTGLGPDPAELLGTPPSLSPAMPCAATHCSCGHPWEDMNCCGGSCGAAAPVPEAVVPLSLPFPLAALPPDADEVMKADMAASFAARGMVRTGAGACLSVPRELHESHNGRPRHPPGRLGRQAGPQHVGVIVSSFCKRIIRIVHSLFGACALRLMKRDLHDTSLYGEADGWGGRGGSGWGTGGYWRVETVAWSPTHSTPLDTGMAIGQHRWTGDDSKRGHFFVSQDGLPLDRSVREETGGGVDDHGDERAIASKSIWYH